MVRLREPTGKASYRVYPYNESIDVALTFYCSSILCFSGAEVF